MKWRPRVLPNPPVAPGGPTKGAGWRFGMLPRPGKTFKLSRGGEEGEGKEEGKGGEAPKLVAEWHGESLAWGSSFSWWAAAGCVRANGKGRPGSWGILELTALDLLDKKPAPD